MLNSTQIHMVEANGPFGAITLVKKKIDPAEPAFEYLVRSEDAAREYLEARCSRSKPVTCPKDNHKHLYKLNDGRIRCAQCGYTFQPFMGRWVNGAGLTAVQWLTLVKLFEKSVSINQISKQLKKSYRTTYKFINRIRLAIACHLPEARTYFVGSYGENGSKLTVHNNGASYKDLCDLPVFGVVKLNNMLCAIVMENFYPKDFMKTDYPKQKIGPVLVAHSEGDPFAEIIHCDALDCSDLKQFAKLEYTNGFNQFFDFMIQYFPIVRLLSPQMLPLHLKEMEFRYRYQEYELFRLIINCLCDPIPEYLIGIKNKLIGSKANQTRQSRSDKSKRIKA